jgi:hypothetical protein
VVNVTGAGSRRRCQSSRWASLRGRIEILLWFDPPFVQTLALASILPGRRFRTLTGFESVATEFESVAEVSPHRFALNPISIRRRIASGREGWSSWALAHRSNSRSDIGCNRTVMGVPFPVAGGPRFFFGVTV